MGSDGNGYAAPLAASFAVLGLSATAVFWWAGLQGWWSCGLVSVVTAAAMWRTLKRRRPAGRAPSSIGGRVMEPHGDGDDGGVPLCGLFAFLGIVAVAGLAWAGMLVWWSAGLVGVATAAAMLWATAGRAGRDAAARVEPGEPDWDVWDESLNEPSANLRVVHAMTAEAAAELYASLCEGPGCPGNVPDPLFKARVGVRAKCPGAPVLVFDVWRSGKGLASRIVAIR